MKEIRTFDGQIELRDDGGIPKIVGYAAVFNSLSQDLGGFREVIEPGAFDDVLEDDVRALFNHEPNLILGRTKAGTLRIFVDERGLGYEATPGNRSYEVDLRESIARGDVSQSSFAFRVGADKFRKDDEGNVIRSITKIGRLFDVSPVTYPAYVDATTGIKRMEDWQAEEAPKPDEDPNDDMARQEFVRDWVEKKQKLLRKDRINNNPKTQINENR